MFPVSHITIAGLGLIGGSLAYALRENTDCIVSGIDSDPHTLMDALERGRGAPCGRCGHAGGRRTADPPRFPPKPPMLFCANTSAGCRPAASSPMYAASSRWWSSGLSPCARHTVCASSADIRWPARRKADLPRRTTRCSAARVTSLPPRPAPTTRRLPVCGRWRGRRVRPADHHRPRRHDRMLPSPASCPMCWPVPTVQSPR